MAAAAEQVPRRYVGLGGAEPRGEQLPAPPRSSRKHHRGGPSVGRVALIPLKALAKRLFYIKPDIVFSFTSKSETICAARSCRTRRLQPGNDECSGEQSLVETPLTTAQPQLFSDPLSINQNHFSYLTLCCIYSCSVAAKETMKNERDRG